MQYIIRARYGDVEVNSCGELIDCLFPYGQLDRRVWKSCENDDDFWHFIAEGNESFSDLLQQAVRAVNDLPGRASEIYIPPLLTEGDSDAAIAYVDVLATIAHEYNSSSDNYFAALRKLAQWLSPDCNQKPFASFEKNLCEAAYWIERYRERHKSVHYEDKKGWVPITGYVWQQTRTHSFIAGDSQFDPPDETIWVPGMRHPDNQHAFASQNEGRWAHDPGWLWKDGKGVDDLSVIWTPGARHPDVLHVHASSDIGKWDPDAGYEPIDAQNVLKGVVSRTQKLVSKVACGVVGAAVCGMTVAQILQKDKEKTAVVSALKDDYDALKDVFESFMRKEKH